MSELLSVVSLGLESARERKMQSFIMEKKKEEKEMEKKNKSTPRYNTPFAHIRFEWLRLSKPERKPRQQPPELQQRLIPPRLLHRLSFH